MRLLNLSPLLAAVALLTACQKNEESVQPPNAKTGIVIEDARLVLPIISGSPAAVYFTVKNDTDHEVKVATIDIAGADMAMMHETMQTGGHSTMQMLPTLAIGAHQSVSFAPGGRHVMVTGLAKSLQPRTMTRITINFDDGDKAAAELPVVPPAVGGE